MAQFAGTESSARLAAAAGPAQGATGEPATASFDAEILAASFARVMADPPRAMEYLYARLFVRNPQMRAIFPPEMTRTRAATYQMLASLIGSLGTPDEAERILARLARDHRRFGVREKHYQPFFDALMATAEHVLGPGWTPDLSSAWRAATGYFTAVMSSAAARDAAEHPAWWLGEIVQHDRRTPTIAVLTIRPDKPLSYLPGQHVFVQVPRWPRTWRSYSIANAPRENGLVDLHVRAVPGGMVSTVLVGYSRTGDTVVLGAPRGELTAPDDNGRDLVFLAGGTGLAPVKAIIESVVATARQGRRRAITLYFGVRSCRDLYDMRDLETLVLAYPSLTLVPVAERDLDVPGRTGRLPDVAAAHPSFRDTDVYVSGPAPMVSATVRALAGRVPADRLHHDPLGLLRAARRPHLAASPAFTGHPGP